jgi:hypothetical protein
VSIGTSVSHLDLLQKSLSHLINESQFAKNVGNIAELENFGKLDADVFVCAAGCHYNHSPDFLRELGVGANRHCKTV